MENNKGLFAQIKNTRSLFISADTFEKNLKELMIPRMSSRNVTIFTGELGMHEFDFAMKCESMGVKGSYLKTSNNYGGHTLDGVNKVYFRWKSKKQQFFVSTLNNKILFIGKSMTEALEFHKNSLNGK